MIASSSTGTRSQRSKIAEPAELKSEIRTTAEVARNVGEAALGAFVEQQREIGALKEIVRRLDMQLVAFFGHIERSGSQ